MRKFIFVPAVVAAVMSSSSSGASRQTNFDQHRSGLQRWHYNGTGARPEDSRCRNKRAPGRAHSAQLGDQVSWSPTGTVCDTSPTSDRQWWSRNPVGSSV